MTEQKTATMFLSELTIVDHAYLNNEGVIIGGSFNPSFRVSGNVDPVENVVVDFSTIKKQLKLFVDDNTFGFDHKLWIVNGSSNVTSFEMGDQIVSAEDLMDVTETKAKSLITVITPMCKLAIPRDAIKLIGYTHPIKNPEYNVINAGEWMGQYLNDCFDGFVKVECKNTENAHTYCDQTTNPIEFFRYDHGLKSSTSLGCQNPCHGHLSFLQLECDASLECQTKVLKRITAELDGVTFINRDNVVKLSDDSVSIKYNACTRGLMKATYKLSIGKYGAKFIILNTETTAEHLVDYVADRFCDDLKGIGATGLYLSEGLSKGTFKVI